MNKDACPKCENKITGIQAGELLKRSMEALGYPINDESPTGDNKTDEARSDLRLISVILMNLGERRI